jgi:hypothetical protein
MESRYWGDPINEPMFEVPDVEEVLPELAGMDASVGSGPEEYKDEPLPSLDATWSVLDIEPGMDDMIEKAGESLSKMSELGIFPFQAHGEDRRLFLARFELPKFGEEFQISKNAWRALALVEGEAPPTEGDNPAGFIHFLAGFPIDTVEMLMMIGEFSSSKVTVMPGDGRVTAPVPDFFKWPDKGKLLLNRTALLEFAALFFADNLPGEPMPTKPHWWFRVEIGYIENEEARINIIPGEFLALGVRMMPGEFWGHQKSSPFIYSGNWMDTVYYTSAVIKEVVDPTNEKPYPTYKVQWRKYEAMVNPSDFALYKVGDRVTIVKDVVTEKKSQLWKDNDMQFFGGEEEIDPADIVWQIVPISFYGLDKEE